MSLYKKRAATGGMENRMICVCVCVCACVCVRACVLFSPLHTYGDIHMKTHQQSGDGSSYGDIFGSPQKKSS